MSQALSGIVSKSGVSFKAVVVLALAATLVIADVGASLAAQSAAIVVDARTGKTLYSKDANARRYPASLTKMMTLYLTFEALAKGRISKDTPVVFSANAAAEPPTKLGVRKGGAVTVETAILSMVTKSANDSSTALGEMLGGSEQNFARMMTAKARKLGMNGTVFRNANGLPDPGQFTTARDMAVLGIALREHFPQYYGYFSQRSFRYGKRVINGHNRLLGRIKGVDGIKTGYTRASGYNLVSSVAIDGRRLVAVVMGGKSGRSRDDQMAGLIQTYLPKTSKRGGGELIARNDSAEPMAVAEATGEETIEAPAKPVVAALLPKRHAPTPDPKPVAATEAVNAVAETTVTTPEAKTATMTAYAEATQVDPLATSSVAAGSWVVQVASAPTQDGAKAFLDKATKQAPRALADASGFTVAFEKGGVTYYRARFGGFGSKTAARNACGALKKKNIDCYAVQQ
ncbi:MAG: SPOR domain-containing protein [Mesorhizobium sp.]